MLFLNSAVSNDTNPRKDQRKEELQAPVDRARLELQNDIKNFFSAIRSIFSC